MVNGIVRPTVRMADVVRVVDGDTVDVIFQDGSTDRIRLLGVDTPETTLSNRPYEYGNITDTACLDEWGDLATEFALELLEGQTVGVVLDPTAGDRGYYGRLLAYIHIGDQDFNATLVEQGYARVYAEGESSRKTQYLQLMERARAQGIGLWECELSTPTLDPIATATRTPEPWGAPAQVVIECIFYDGRVYQTEADEYVQITNMGEVVVDLAGWELVNIADGKPSFRFPSYDLGPDESLRVYTNEHHPEWGGFYFGYGRAVWNNRAPDEAALYDAQGQQVSRKSYPPGC
jgi:micrococcal nuclease